jgi:type I restriction enzyme S subunit
MAKNGDWKIFNLDDAFWFQEGPGVRTWQFKDSGIKLLNVANIEKNKTLNLDKTARYLSLEEVENKYNHFLISAGDLVIASSGISFDSDGMLRTRGAIVKEHHLPLCLNTSTIRFKEKSEISQLGYLHHWLDSREFREQITRLVTGSAQQNFGPSHLKAIKIPLPPLPEQRRIAAILDQADALRAKRREALVQLDKLTQSIFIEMFGDPVTNPKGWGMSAFGTVCETRLGKMLDQKQQTGEHSYKYIRNANVQWFHFDLSAVFEMDFDENARNTFSLKDGDLLICEGGEPGRAAIWRNQITNCYYQKALHRARPNLNVAVPEYLMWLLWFLAHRGGLGDHITSATISHLTGEKLKAMTIPVPPITLQNQFVVQLTAVDKIKSKHQKSLFELDNLFASLQHSAFHGEL